MSEDFPTQPPSGHSLIELVAAMACSAVLLAGLGSVMLIARQIAYVPTSSTAQIDAATVVNRFLDELRFATWIIEESDTAIEFVVADRTGDGVAERIRYEWSGTPGEPLEKTFNGSTTIAAAGVQNFQLAYQNDEDTVRLTPYSDGSEVKLSSDETVQGTGEYAIDYQNWASQQINPSAFSAIPAGATSWNATRVDFYGHSSAVATQTLLLQLRSSGNPYYAPTSETLGTITVAESSLTSGAGWNSRYFSSPIRGLSLTGRYNLVWASADSFPACQLTYGDTVANGVSQSTGSDVGASWQYMPSRRIFYRLYGTYSTPGTPVDVTRPFLAAATVTFQTSGASNSRIDAGVKLENRPELILAAWRADFESDQPDPTAVDVAGDGTMDWQLAGASFDDETVAEGYWEVDGSLESRPDNNFTGVTIIDARCRDGAVLRINADRQGGTFGPLIVRVSQTSSGQTLTLSGETAVNTEKTLATVERLANEWVRFELLIVPQQNIVQLTVQGQVVGSYVYPTYAPSTTNRSVTLSGNGSDFDYVEARVASEAFVDVVD